MPRRAAAFRVRTKQLRQAPCFPAAPAETSTELEGFKTASLFLLLAHVLQEGKPRSGLFGSYIPDTQTGPAQRSGLVNGAVTDQVSCTRDLFGPEVKRHTA